MERRSVLRLVSIGVVSPGFDALRASLACQATQPPASAEPYRLRFFSEAENEMLDRLMDMILPADSHSPGAHEAKVSLFADWMVSTSDATVQRQWREGLRVMTQEAGRSSPEAALAKAAANEARPSTELERFFTLLKNMTVDGYYTSEIGIHKDLEYQGNTYVPEYKGCSHPEHQRSSG